MEVGKGGGFSLSLWGQDEEGRLIYQRFIGCVWVAWMELLIEELEWEGGLSSGVTTITLRSGKGGGSHDGQEVSSKFTWGGCDLQKMSS